MFRNVPCSGFYRRPFGYRIGRSGIETECVMHICCIFVAKEGTFVKKRHILETRSFLDKLFAEVCSIEPLRVSNHGHM